MDRDDNSNLTRSSSRSSSAFSNINVAGFPRQGDENTSERVSPSTPPTSLGDTGSVGSVKVAADTADGIHTRRSTRATKGAKSTHHNLDPEHGVDGSRSVSGLTGRTLVDREDSEDDVIEAKQTQKSTFPSELPPRVPRRPSVKDRVKKAAGSITSVLGKRRRRTISKREAPGDSTQDKNDKARKVLKELDMGSKGLLDEMDLEAEDEILQETLPNKRRKKQTKEASRALPSNVAPVPAATSNGVPASKGKKWQYEGLYVGQEASDDGTQAARKKLQKKRPNSSSSNAPINNSNSISLSGKAFMTLPMFDFLSKTRDFVVPYDVFAPSFKKGDEKPKDWHQLNRNRLVGEAKELWEKEAPLARSLCICQPPAPHEQGCDYDCLNRAMHYECDYNNCCLDPSQCSNRAFSSLATRMKKGGAFDVGVEVIKTPNRGFGVRACRTFAPGEIIMEYTGEIISEAECQRRMREIYNGKNCYYVMEFDKGLVIDGTRGSMARFVNHSCEPNCEVRMVKVAGTPRMGVFAGESGVFTGEELSYDYNFDNFGEARQACYCGAKTCRGHLNKRLNAAEQKLRDKEERERKKQAEEEAQKRAVEVQKTKAIKSQRGSGWRGWVAVGDIKQQLKEEKAARDEAEKTSARARRLAERQSLPGPSESIPPSVTSERLRRAIKASSAGHEDGELLVKQEVKTKSARPSHKRTFSVTSATGVSKFTEDFSSPIKSGHTDREEVVTAKASPEISSRKAIKRAEISTTTSVRANITVDTVISASDDSSPASRKRPAESKATEDANDVDVLPTAKKRKQTNSADEQVVATKSKGLNVLRGVGQAVRSTFQQGKAKVMRQSTLSFTKMD